MTTGEEHMVEDCNVVASGCVDETGVFEVEAEGIEEVDGAVAVVDDGMSNSAGRTRGVA